MSAATATAKPHPMTDVTAKDSQERNVQSHNNNTNSNNKRGGNPPTKLSEEVLKSNDRTTSPVNRASNTSPLSQASTSTRMSHNPYAAPRSPLSGSPSMPNAPGTFDGAYSGTTSPVLAASSQYPQQPFPSANNRGNTNTFFSNPPPLPPMQQVGNYDASYDGTGTYSSSPVGGATSGSGHHHPSAFNGYNNNNDRQQYGRGGAPRNPQPRGGGGSAPRGGAAGRGGGGANNYRTVSPNNSISGYDRELTELVGAPKAAAAAAPVAPSRPTAFSTPTKEIIPTASNESTPTGVQSITREYRNGRPIPSLKGSNPPSQDTSLLMPSTNDSTNNDRRGGAPHNAAPASHSRSLSPTELAMMNIASEITADDEPTMIPQPRSLKPHGHQQAQRVATAAASLPTEDGTGALPDFVVVDVQFRNDRRHERHVMRYPAECLGITSAEMLQNAFVIVEGDRGVDLGRIIRMDEVATNNFLDSLLHVQKRRFAREEALGPLDEVPAGAEDASEDEEAALYLTDEEESILMSALSSTEIKVMMGVLPSDKLTTSQCGPMTFLTDEEIGIVHDSQTTDKHRRTAAHPGRSSAFYPLHTYDEGQLDDATTANFVKSVLTSEHSTRSPTNAAAVFHHHRNILVRANGYMQQLQRESKGHPPASDYFIRRLPASSIISRFCKFPLVLRNATQEEVDEYHTGLVMEEQRALQSAQELAHQHLPVCNPGLTVLNGTSLNADGTVQRPPRGQAPQFFVDIVDATFQFDKNKLTLWYVSSERVYFVPLLKALNQRYRCRIWMERLAATSSSPTGSHHHHHNHHEGGSNASPAPSSASFHGSNTGGSNTRHQQQSYTQMRENGFHSSTRNHNNNNNNQSSVSNNNHNNNNVGSSGSAAASSGQRSTGRRGPAPSSHQSSSSYRDPAVTGAAPHSNNNSAAPSAVRQNHQGSSSTAAALGASGRRAPAPKSQVNANPVKRLSFDDE